MSWDEIWTPHEALAPLVPYLPVSSHDRQFTVWEMAPGEGHLVNHLADEGYMVVGEDRDGLKWEPYYDLIVTNPPYSKKHLFLQRAVELEKPFALLLPVTTLGVRRCQKWLSDVDVLFLKRRVDFTGGKAPWFSVAWFTRNMLPERMVFEK